MSDYLTIIQLLLTLATLLIFIFILRMHKRTKSVDTTIQCQKRYDDFRWELKTKVINGELDEESYYERYWNLQLEQFQYWKLGFIHDEIYYYWLTCRHKEWHNNEKLDKMKYQDGWEHALTCIGDTKIEGIKFTDFMKMVFKGEIVKAFSQKYIR